MTQRPSLDRRLTPRPLPAHLASAMLLWLSSRAALTSLSSGLPPLNKQSDRLTALAGEIRRAGPEAVGAALDRQLGERAAGFQKGLDAYRRHPYRRAEPPAELLWQRGAARLLDYSPGGDGPVVLLVPSLVNRCHILDLLPERSFARYLAMQNLRPLVLDWGEPDETEHGYGLGAYIGLLAEAVAATRRRAGRPIALGGYCMGGLLALALALRQPADVTCLALLATPWDFHAGQEAQARLLANVMDRVPYFLSDDDPVPVEVIQGLFMSLDPFLAERKFVRFAGFELDSAAAREFVALEDWINDGVPLARKTALECARSWYRDNDPGRGAWTVEEQAVRPETLSAPALVVLPRRDRIVPPRSAEPLAAAIPDATVLRPSLGHIGMMASPRAPETVWQPIAAWLRAQFA